MAKRKEGENKVFLRKPPLSGGFLKLAIFILIYLPILNIFVPQVGQTA
jgi:hypothetical protein